MQQAGGPATRAVRDQDVWAVDALASLARLPGVRRVGLALSERGGRRHRFTSSDRPRSWQHGVRVLDWCHVDAYDDVPLNTAVRTGEPVMGNLDDLSTLYPAFVESHREGAASLAAVPLAAAGESLGGFVLFFEKPQAFDHPQRARLMRLGRTLGQALRSLRVPHQRHGRHTEEPAPAGALVADHVVGTALEEVAVARRFLTSQLTAWEVGDDVSETAALCLSEIVTNALVHTHSGCDVRLVLHDGELTTTVRDQGPRDPMGDPVGSDEDPLRVHGRGLDLIDALVDKWGSVDEPDGTTVWFVLSTVSQ